MALRNNAFEYLITPNSCIKARRGEDIHFLKLCGLLHCCTSQGGTRISSWCWSAAVADGLFVLQGAVSSAQRVLAARAAVARAGCDLCWLAFYTASVEAEISSNTHTRSADTLSLSPPVDVWRHGVYFVCLCRCMWCFSVHLFLRTGGASGWAPNRIPGPKVQRKTDRERERSEWKLVWMKAEGERWETWELKMAWAVALNSLRCGTTQLVIFHLLPIALRLRSQKTDHHMYY